MYTKKLKTSKSLNNFKAKMFKKFTTKQLIFIALMGALMFVLSFVLGSALNVLINPSASGFTSALIQPILIVVALLIMKRFGVATMMYLIYGILAIPTNMVGGFPGPIKILIVFIMGIVPDIVAYIKKYEKWSILLGLVIMYIITIPLMIYLYIKLGIPGADKFLKAVPFLACIFFFEGVVGWYLGIKIYNKIKNKRFVKQISS